MSRASASAQPDLFGAPQPDLFADQPAPERKPRSYAPDPADVRAHLHEIVETARAAETMPWPPRKVGFYKTVVPQMVRWLPDEEAARVRLAFEREMERLEASRHAGPGGAGTAQICLDSHAATVYSPNHERSCKGR